MLKRLLRGMIFGLVAASAAPALAESVIVVPVVPLNNPARLHGNPALELHILRSQQRRLDFQQEQQFYRELDRQALRPPRPEVPRMQRNCQLHTLGAHFLPNCR